MHIVLHKKAKSMQFPEEYTEKNNEWRTGKQTNIFRKYNITQKQKY